VLLQLETNADLSESRFQQLDGTVDTWEDALSLFRGLLALIPHGVLCVLDGLQWLDDRSTDKHLELLLQNLRGDKLMVVVTTTGSSACLQQAVPISETFVVETVHPRGATEGLNQHGFWLANMSRRL
jgi:hypothetical protein